MTHSSSPGALMARRALDGDEVAAVVAQQPIAVERVP